MEKTTNLNIKIDRELKIRADKLFNDMGMNLTTAVNVFVRQAVLERAIPFRIYRGFGNTVPVANNEERRAAMREVRELLTGMDGNSIDLLRMRAERRAARFEHHD